MSAYPEQDVFWQGLVWNKFVWHGPFQSILGIFLAAFLLLPIAVNAEKSHSVSNHGVQNHSVPNILLIVADYMGYSDIEPYGATDIRTPALSTLAQQGLRFSNYYAAAPTCISSRAALLSGKYPSKVLTPFSVFNRDKGLPAQNNTLLRELKTEGYKTALVGKWHLGSNKNFKPADHGFDFFYGFDDWTLGYHDHLTSNGEPGLLRNGVVVNETGYLTELFSDEAVQFIESSVDKPFFLYLSYNTGLPPYQGPHLDESKWDSGWDVNEASRADYVSMVESMDSGISRVLAKLEELELTENTLVIFTYDHGGRHLVDSGPLFHGFSTLWEGGIHVPMILRWPSKLEGGRTISTPTIAMDLTASMLDAANRDAAISPLDGISLFPLLAKPGQVQPQPRTFFWRWGAMKAARRGEWKYVIDGHSQLLFNLAQDIGERHNVFAKHPYIAKQMKGALHSWEESLE